MGPSEGGSRERPEFIPKKEVPSGTEDLTPDGKSTSELHIDYEAGKPKKFTGFKKLTDGLEPSPAPRQGRRLVEPNRESDAFKQKPHVYELKYHVYNLLADLSRAEVADRLPCDASTLSRYVTTATWWEWEAVERLVRAAVELHGAEGEIHTAYGRLREAFDEAEKIVAPQSHEIKQLRAKVDWQAQRLADANSRLAAAQQQAAAAGSAEEEAAQRQRIAELEDERDRARAEVGKLMAELAVLQARLSAAGDPDAVLEAARYAADGVAGTADPEERRKRALEVVADLDRPDETAEFIGRLGRRGCGDAAKAVVEDIVQRLPAARLAELLTTFDERVGGDPLAREGADAGGLRMPAEAELSRIYRASTERDLRMAVLSLLDAEGFASLVHVLHARRAPEFVVALLGERVAQRAVTGMQEDAYALRQRAQDYLMLAHRCSPQEIADLVTALRAADQDQEAAWVIEVAGELLVDVVYQQLETLLLAAGRIHDLRILRECRDRRRQD